MEEDGRTQLIESVNEWRSKVTDAVYRAEKSDAAYRIVADKFSHLKKKYIKDLAHQQQMHWYYSELSTSNACRVRELKEHLYNTYIDCNETKTLLENTDVERNEWKQIAKERLLRVRCLEFGVEEIKTREYNSFMKISRYIC